MIEPQAQDDSLATYAPQINKEEGRINWACSALSIDRIGARLHALARRLSPVGLDAQLRILAGRKGEGSAEPGRVIIIDGAAAIGTGDGLFFPTRLQMAGKRPLHIADFVNGYRDFAGARLGD